MVNWRRWLRSGSKRHGRGSDLDRRYEKIAKKISPFDLQHSGRSDSELTLTEADMLEDLTAAHFHTHRILGYYTEEGFQYALAQYGLLDKIRERGFRDIRFTFDLDDPKRQHITCHAKREDVEHLLMDLMMGRIRHPEPEGLEPPGELELLSIEWMMLQNSCEGFSDDHRRWPGQKHPGLGLNDEVMMLHIQSARRLGLDGVVNHPSRYHIAFLGRGRVWFLDPTVQGRFDALLQTLSNLELGEATWKMERGEVHWADDGSVIEWLPEKYVFPTSERLETYFQSPFYQQPRSRSFERARARGIRLLPTAT